MTRNRKARVLNTVILFLLALATVSLVQKHFQKVEYRGRIVAAGKSETVIDSEALRARLSAPAPYPRPPKGYQAIPFEQLTSFEYRLDSTGRRVVKPDGSLPALPDQVKKLHRKNIAISGFMVPVKFRDTLTCEFLLVPNRLHCCYGQDPEINEWVLVQTPRPQKVISDKPVTVSGEILVDEIMQEDVVLGLYKLTAHRVEVFKDL